MATRSTAAVQNEAGQHRTEPGPLDSVLSDRHVPGTGSSRWRYFFSGVWLAYLIQPVTLIVYFVFAILGGLWFPLTGFLGHVGQFTPTYEAVKIGTDVIQGAAVPAGLAIGLVIWLGIFAALATIAVRSTAEAV